MRQLCAWCHAELRVISTASQTEGAASHGICRDCLVALEHRHGEELLKLVECMPHPVIAVDSSGRVRAANVLACELLGTASASFQGRRIREVFGCKHSYESGGCEAGAECAGCELHRLVLRTFQMGNNQVAALSLLNAPAFRGSSASSHLITTLRAGQVVALRIDPLTIRVPERVRGASVQTLRGVFPLRRTV